MFYGEEMREKVKYALVELERGGKETTINAIVQHLAPDLTGLQKHQLYIRVYTYLSKLLKSGFVRCEKVAYKEKSIIQNHYFLQQSITIITSCLE